jgi:hypothetical protein
VGFEPTIPVFERVKTINALDSAATVIGDEIIRSSKIVDNEGLHTFVLIAKYN